MNNVKLHLYKTIPANRALLLCNSYSILQNTSSIDVFFSSISSEPVSAATSLKNKSDIVLSLFKNHGFTDTQVSKLRRIRPQVFFSDPYKTLLPKLQFIQSTGVSTTQLAKIISSNPTILSRSLHDQLIPCYNYLKRVLVLDEHLVRMLNRNSRILLHDVQKNIAPNLSALTKIGVPQSLILFILLRFPSVAHQNHDKFKTSLKEVIKMGFNPLRSTFVQAVHVVVEMTKRTWDHKMEVYGRWGLSHDEIMLAFRSHPLCMNLSEGKIMSGMDFFVNQMGWPAVKIARCPAVLFYNLEKRIIPRCGVIKALMSEGLVKKNFALSTFLRPTEKRFLDRFVRKYEDNYPGLTNVYLREVGTEKEFES